MGELPDERMREAVEAVRETFKFRSDLLGSLSECDVRAVIRVVLPLLSAPPSQLPAEPSETWTLSCESIQPFSGMTAVKGPRLAAGKSVVVCRVDSRPSLDLTAKLDEMRLHDDTEDPFDAGYMRAIREMDEFLARRQGTGQ